MDNSISFCVAKSRAELSACRQILKTVFVEEEGFALQIPDQYENQATYLFAKNSNELIGCLRVVVATSQLKTPVESIPTSPRVNALTRYGEISRFAILPRFRGMVLGSRAYQTCWQLCLDLGLEHVIAEARYEIRFLHKRLGFREYGEPFYDPDMQSIDKQIGQPNAVLMVAALKDLLRKPVNHQPLRPLTAAL